MRAKDIQLNKIYTIRNNPNYFKPKQILKPKEGVNTTKYIIIKGELSTTANNFNFALIKYFKLSDINKGI